MALPAQPLPLHDHILARYEIFRNPFGRQMLGRRQLIYGIGLEERHCPDIGYPIRSSPIVPGSHALTQPPFDVPRAHRWFATECNNQAWEIVEAGEHTPEAVERLMHLAHATLLHWSAVGTSLNRQRALDLLAHAYVAAGRGELALQYARQAFDLSEQHAAEQTPFDRAQAFATMSVALRAASQADDAESWKHKAQAAADELDADERDAIQRLLLLGASSSP